jgi:hypothetical protein
MYIRLLLLAFKHHVFVLFELFELNKFFIDRVFKISSLIDGRLTLTVVGGARRLSLPHVQGAHLGEALVRICHYRVARKWL